MKSAKHSAVMWHVFQNSMGISCHDITDISGALPMCQALCTKFLMCVI